MNKKYKKERKWKEVKKDKRASITSTRDFIFKRQLKKSHYSSLPPKDEKQRQLILLVEAIAASITLEDIAWAKEQIKIEPMHIQTSLFDTPTEISTKRKVLERIIDAPNISLATQERAKLLIFQANASFIYQQAKKRKMDNEICLLEDVYQSGCEGFLETLERFEVQKIFTSGLRSFAVHYIKKFNIEQITVAHKRVGQIKENLTWRSAAKRYIDLFYSKNEREPDGDELYEFVAECKYQEFLIKEKAQYLEEDKIIALIKKRYKDKYTLFVKNHELDLEDLIIYIFSPNIDRDKMSDFLHNSYYVHSLGDEIKSSSSECRDLINFIENKEAIKPDEYNEEFTVSEIEKLYKTLKESQTLSHTEIGIFERAVGIEGFEKYPLTEIQRYLRQTGSKFSHDEVKASYQNTIEILQFTWQLQQKKNTHLRY